MKLVDIIGFSVQSLRSQRVRTSLIVLAMAIGTGGVVVLTWLGDAARQYVVGQFDALGTNLVIVLPGRNETTGAAPPLLGETSRDLTLDDAFALLRSPAIRRIAPVVVGGAMVSFGNRSRETTVLGSTSQLLPVRRLELAMGRFLPDDREAGEAVCVLGATVRRELFLQQNPLGEFVRVGDRRYRVAGVLASAGMSLGTDLDEMVVLPVVAAQALFDSPGLFRVIAEATSKAAVPQAVADVERLLTERHEGENDVTVITQDAVSSTFDGILQALTLAVAGIAAISLVVAGILIMNVMVVAVTQRRAEVGLLKALGADARTIQNLFLGEALLLSMLGGATGLALGEVTSRVLPHFAPVLRPGMPGWAAGAAAIVAIGAGLVFGTAPARRAARLEAVDALAKH
ncbi:MAG TPA: ABC transporter permease [Planctomycetota bacterium]|nr:ABC transporter permease [Planctomycetota bacterium]